MNIKIAEMGDALHGINMREHIPTVIAQQLLPSLGLLRVALSLSAHPHHTLVRTSRLNRLGTFKNIFFFFFFCKY